MTPTRRKAEKKAKPEKSIGATGALSSNDAQKPAAAASAKVDSAQAASPAVEGGEEASKKAASQRPSVAKGGSKKLRIALAALAVVVVLASLAFSWYRWLYGNDALNIRGTWYVNGSDATITITEEEIILSDDVSYTYVLDPAVKSIEYFFSDLSGCGHYRFSLDRGELAIIDGECSGADSLTGDLAWLMSALFYAAQGKEAAPAEGENVMLLSREPVTLVAEGATVDAAGAAVEGEPADAAGAAEPAASSTEEASDGAA